MMRNVQRSGLEKMSGVCVCVSVCLKFGVLEELILLFHRDEFNEWVLSFIFYIYIYFFFQKCKST